MKTKVQMFKIIKIFKWTFTIKVPDFLNPWELSGNTVIFDKPPSKEDIVSIHYES